MRSARYLLGLTVLLSGGVACAAPLFSVWQLEPVGETGEMEVTEGTEFLQQRLVPLRMVRLDEAAEWKKRKVLEAGTVLFTVYQADGQIAYCTIKDQSSGNAAKSLFIPMLDKRPCLVDDDSDGVFDRYFTVFDKYGSALTPSGNLSSAKRMHAPAAYSLAPSSEFPVERRFAYSMISIDNAEKRSLSVRYDNGRGWVLMGNDSPQSTPSSPAALNLVTHVLTVEGDTARIRTETDTNYVIVGHSDGTFAGMPLPHFAQPRGS